MDFLEAVLVDDKMKDDDYLGPDLLILEDVEAIPSEDHVSVSPWPIDRFLEKEIFQICQLGFLYLTESYRITIMGCD